MKQLSARRFRVDFPTLTEPVTVLRRDPDGNLTVLGTWSPGQSRPSETAPDRLAWLESQPGFAWTDAEKELAAANGRTLRGFGTPKAAPKPSQSRKPAR